MLLLKLFSSQCIVTSCCCLVQFLQIGRFTHAIKGNENLISKKHELLNNNISTGNKIKFRFLTKLRPTAEAIYKIARMGAFAPN